MDRDAIHVSVGPGKIQVFKLRRNYISETLRDLASHSTDQVRRVRFHLHNLRESRGLALLQEHGLAGQNVNDVLEPELPESNGLGSKGVVCGTLERFGWSRAHAEWSDTVLIAAWSLVKQRDPRPENQNIPETQDSEAGNHGSAGKCTLASSVDLAQRSEDVVHAGAGLAKLTKSPGENVESEGRDISNSAITLENVGTHRSSESESVLTWRRASKSRNLTSSGAFTRFPLTLMERPKGELTKKGCASDLYHCHVSRCQI